MNEIGSDWMPSVEQARPKYAAAVEEMVKQWWFLLGTDSLLPPIPSRF
jgi:hypothetical protein